MRRFMSALLPLHFEVIDQDRVVRSVQRVDRSPDRRLIEMTDRRLFVCALFPEAGTPG